MFAKRPAPEVARIEASFPLPQAEYTRLAGRRWILDRIPKGGVGAEIGVFRGHFSEMICAHLRPQRLYLVDPWRLAGERFAWGGAYTNNGTLPTELARAQTAARVAQFPQTESILIEGWYPACDAQIPEPLDFAYLDAAHRFDETLAELQVLHWRIKPGGLIFGDDWNTDPRAPHHGVYRAVQAFVRNSDWEVMVAGPAGQWAIRRATDRGEQPTRTDGDARPIPWDRLPGVLMPVDQAALGWSLDHQARCEAPGDLADLSQPVGKGAIVLGRALQPGEDLLVASSEPPDALARLWHGYLAQAPRVLDAPLARIVDELAPGRLRLLRLGGGVGVAELTALRDRLRPGGVLVLARTDSPAGPAPDPAARWQGLLEAGLVPICETDFSFYACSGDPGPLQAAIARAARATDWCTTAPPHAVGDHPVFRLHRRR